MDLLVANDYEWLKRIVRFGDLKVEPSAFIGEKRNVDLLICRVIKSYAPSVSHVVFDIRVGE